MFPLLCVSEYTLAETDLSVNQPRSRNENQKFARRIEGTRTRLRGTGKMNTGIV
jgi:hypothetical protein